MARILNIAELMVFLFLFVAMANGSIKWRRITKTTPAAIHTTTTEATASETKTPITWKRTSTLSRMSTTKRDVTSHEEDIEEEEIEVADSREDISILEDDTEQEPSIKPLVPGSRPGFWFDSSRRKKPSSLLRPGSRKSSLFPSKPSTTSITNTTTESPTTNSVPSVTTPRSVHSSGSNHTLSSKSNVFGRNHSTKPPIAFKRRLKTTKSPRKPTTTAIPDVEKLDSDQELHRESEENVIEKEKTTVSSIVHDIPIEKINNKSYESVRLPGSGIRRRLKNGTRAPWRKEGDRFSSSSTAKSLLKISRTTPFPQSKSLKTTPKKVTTPGYSRSTRKPTVPSRIISRTKTNKTTSLPHRTRSSTPIPAFKSDPKTYAKKPTTVIKGPTNFLRNRNVHRFNRLKPNLMPDEIEKEEEEEHLDITSSNPLKKIEFIENIAPELDLNTKSTVEPFYITRDYGELVTAIPEVRRKKGRIPNRATTSTPAAREAQDIEKLQSEEVNDTKIDTINKEIEMPLDNTLQFSAADDVLQLPESISRHSVQSQRSTTPKPPTTIPFISPTIDPGTNAYVVWSLGQGGSGWSYEKQGGQVKWSAQNSQAEGDRWSVQGAEEKGTSNPAVWAPTNSTSSAFTDNKSEWVASNPEKNMQVPSTNGQKGFHNANYWTPVTYMPNIPYRNETFLKLTTPADVKNLSPNDIKGFSPLPPGITDFSPIIFQNVDNNLSSGHPSYPIQNIDTPAFGTNAHYQNIETEAYTLTNQTSSINVPNASKKGPNFTEINDKEQINVSNVQEYLAQPLKTSTEWNLPTTVAAPLEGFYGLEFENQFLKSTNPSFQTDEMPSFDIPTVPESFVDDFRSNVDSIDNILQGFNQQARDLSGIPPELAKAVLDAKRWTVVGTGGADGWSLLGENGQLEWKIHNMDGKWSVVSGDKSLKLPVQVSPPYQEVQNDDRNEKEDLNQENGKSTLDSPKIWNLEDDYNKWKVLSAEGGIQVESPEQQWIPTREYEYGPSDELEDDYYDDEGDYEVLSANNFSPPSHPEIFDDRPLWGTGENQMVRRHPGGESTDLSLGGIESVNTKEDAIEAWKSLLVDRGNWKNSNENFREIPRKNSKHSITRPSPENSEWKKQSRTTSEPFVNIPEKNIKETYSGFRPSENNNKLQEKIKFKHNPYNNFPAIDETNSRFVEKFDGNQDKAEETKTSSHSNFHHKDNAKIDMLINKLEKVQKGASGRAVVDLSQLLKLIKTNRNLTSLTFKVKENSDVRNRTQETDLKDTHVRDYKNDRHQKFDNQEDSELQRYQESDKFLSENKYEQQHGAYKTYAGRYKQDHETSVERFSNIPLPANSRFKEKFPFDTIDRQNEGNARDQNVSFRKFIKDKIYNQEHMNADQKVNDNLPLRLLNNQVYRPFEESEANQMKSRFKHKKDRIPNSVSKQTGKNQNSLRHFNVDNKPELSNFENSPEEQRITANKNPEATQYESDINSSSEELKIRRKLPFDSPNHRRKTGNDAEKRAYTDVIDSGTDYQFINDGRQVPRNKPKRKNNRFYTAPHNQPREHNENLEGQIKHSQHAYDNYPLSNRDSNEMYTTMNKYYTSRNHRKRPQVGKSRPQSNGKPGHSKMHSGTRFPLDSSSEKLITSGRKQTQVFEGYEQYRSPEENVYESSPEVHPIRQRMRPSKHNQPSPIVISSETEIEDDEDGSKKNRKIIVIDYAGRQKKKSPIDRKDLELIIRSVKNRRSGLMEDFSNENLHLDAMNGQ